MRIFWVTGFFVISLAGNVHGEPLIRGAFGLRLGVPVDVSRLKSRPIQSEVYIGALHHYFRPKYAHPLLDDNYSVWVTPQSRTVIAIRADGGFTYTYGSKYESWPSYHSMLKSGQAECRTNRNRLALQLDGRYALPRQTLEDGGNRYVGAGRTGGHYFWYTYTDGHNKIRLGCRDSQEYNKNHRHEITISLELYYELGNYRGLLTREGGQLNEARGL